MTETHKDDYLTKDLGEAAVLLCKSLQLLRLDKELNFYWFVFTDKTSCQKISHQYWFGTCLVNAKTYNDALRTLKDRIFAKE